MEIKDMYTCLGCNCLMLKSEYNNCPKCKTPIPKPTKPDFMESIKNDLFKLDRECMNRGKIVTPKPEPTVFICSECQWTTTQENIKICEKCGSDL